MPRPGRPTKDEWRARQATNSDKFYSTNPEYNQLYDLIHNENTSAADCTKPFVDRTIELAASPDSEREIGRFVSIFAAAIVELGARTAYGNSDIQSKLVDFVHELQKAVVTDPNSITGEPLSYCEEQESILWTDLPMFRLWCSEEMISFGKYPRHKCAIAASSEEVIQRPSVTYTNAQFMYRSRRPHQYTARGRALEELVSLLGWTLTF